MIKLKNNYTTPKQSKRLLKLGVPADSADQVYYKDAMWSAHEFLSPKHPYSEVVKGHENISIPCWSVGRMMEIIGKTATFHPHGFLCFMHDEADELVEHMMRAFEDLIKKDRLDFSLLNEQ